MKSWSDCQASSGRLFGKTIRTTIGDTRTWELGRARSEANRLRSLIDGGVDPREHRLEQQAAHTARQVEARRRDVTFGDAWDEYVAARKASWGDLHHRDHIRLADKGGQPGLTQAGPLAAMRPLKLTATFSVPAMRELVFPPQP